MAMSILQQQYIKQALRGAISPTSAQRTPKSEVKEYEINSSSSIYVPIRSKLVGNEVVPVASRCPK